MWRPALSNLAKLISLLVVVSVAITIRSWHREEAAAARTELSRLRGQFTEIERQLATLSSTASSEKLALVEKYDNANTELRGIRMEVSSLTRQVASHHLRADEVVIYAAECQATRSRPKCQATQQHAPAVPTRNQTNHSM